MANEIVQGDNGTILSLTISDDQGIIDLTGTTVQVNVQYRKIGIIKNATITDAANGKCEVTLTSDDLQYQGTFPLQATVTFQNGTSFSSDIQYITIKKKLDFVPSVGGGSGSLSQSTNNGNIIVNGVEIKVYDDTSIKSRLNTDEQDISTLKAFLPLLNRLGIDSNGNLTVDGKIVGSAITPTNTAPSISSTYNMTSVYDTTSISIPYTVTDAEGGSFTATYSIDGVRSNTNVSTGDNTWSVGILSVGSHTLSIKVTDNGSLDSNVLTFNISVSATADTTPPQDVTGLQIGTATVNSIPVSWTLSSSNDVANYEVAYSNGGAYTVASSLINSSSTSYTINGLTAGTNYTIRVVVIDTSGNRSSGVTINGSTIASTATVGSATVGTATVA